MPVAIPERNFRQFPFPPEVLFTAAPGRPERTPAAAAVPSRNHLRLPCCPGSRHGCRRVNSKSFTDWLAIPKWSSSVLPSRSLPGFFPGRRSSRLSFPRRPTFPPPEGKPDIPLTRRIFPASADPARLSGPLSRSDRQGTKKERAPSVRVLFSIKSEHKKIIENFKAALHEDCVRIAQSDFSQFVQNRRRNTERISRRFWAKWRKTKQGVQSRQAVFGRGCLKPRSSLGISAGRRNALSRQAAKGRGLAQKNSPAL